MFTAVVIAGATTLGLVGNYTYFGQTAATLAHQPGIAAVLLCSTIGGLAGGVFSWSLVLASRGLPGRLGQMIIRYPVAFAALCGLCLAVLGYLSAGQTYGTGYEQARGLVEEHSNLTPVFALLKLAATIVSYVSGIPGGIFAPSLSIGAGLGQVLAPLVPNAPVGAMILLGMTAYFSGVVQAPITATVIVMEMTANQSLTIALMATAFLSFGVLAPGVPPAAVWRAGAAVPVPAGWHLGPATERNDKGSKSVLKNKRPWKSQGRRCRNV